MKITLIITLILIFLLLYFYNNNKLNQNENIDLDLDKEKFESNCWIYGNDYNSCYSNSNCTIGFLDDGSTHCMKKFLEEDI